MNKEEILFSTLKVDNVEIPGTLEYNLIKEIGLEVISLYEKYTELNKMHQQLQALFNKYPVVKPMGSDEFFILIENIWKWKEEMNNKEW